MGLFKWVKEQALGEVIAEYDGLGEVSIDGSLCTASMALCRRNGELVVWARLPDGWEDAPFTAVLRRRGQRRPRAARPPPATR